MKLTKRQWVTAGIAEAYCLFWGWIIPSELIWRWFFYFFVPLNLFILFSPHLGQRLKVLQRLEGTNRKLRSFIRSLVTILALLVGFNSWFRTAMLTTASVSGRASAVHALLSVGTDPNRAIERFPTPLIVASSYGQAEVVELLLQNGADVNRKSAEGYSALSVAQTKGHSHVVDILKAAGAEE